MRISLELAKRMLHRAVSEAKGLGKPFSVAIVDERGWLVALHRMDGAPAPTAEIARDKAWTAAVFRLPSTEVGRFGDPQQPGFGLHPHDWNDRLCTLPGGLPIEVAGQMIGAVGVSGGTADEDLAICRAVLQELDTKP